MKNCCVVCFNKNEKLLFYNYLKNNGYRLSNGSDVFDNIENNYPLGIYLENKVVVVTNDYFLKKYASVGGEVLNFDMFKKLVGLKNAKSC